MNNPGLTPAQINKAINGVKANKSTPLNSPLIKKSKPDKAVRLIPKQDNSLLLNLPYSDNNIIYSIPTPDWFTFNSKADVSVIVPLYKSSIEDLVESWDFLNDGLKVELIFIDDNCPSNSQEKVVAAWMERKSEVLKPIGRLFKSEATQGWGACCNFGAQCATGSILVFLNPTGKLFPGWLTSLTKILKKSEVGLVGGLHVDEANDVVIEAGREWSWEHNKFLDIGSETYNGKKLTKSFSMTNTPIDIFQASEREMISSSLAAVRTKNFLDWGGFSCNVFTQEWSDADLCMRVKENGLKIMYQPNARLYRSTFDKTDKYSKHGEAYFFNQWVTSSRIDSLIKDKRSVTQPVENILIRRQAAHGDVLVAAAIAPALKKKYPGCKILFATECPEVLENNPWIDKIVTEHSERQFQLFCNLDMAYEYRPNCNILSAYAEAAGVDVKDCELFLDTQPIDVELPEKYIVIHAGKTLWAGRNWTALKFDQVSNRIRNADYKIVCVGTLSDHKPFSCDVDLRGKTNIQQLAGVIKSASLFVGIDSFPMHIAQVFDTPGVAFFGSIKPETRIVSDAMVPVYADGIKCLGCHHRKPTPCVGTTTCYVGVQECIIGVSADTMWLRIQKVLENKLNA